MVAGDKQGMNLILKQFKKEGGQINFPLVLQVPRNERLPDLAKKDFVQTAAILNVALTGAFENMALRKGMDEEQILDLTEAIIDTSSEDNLSLEDLMLFLQRLVRGEYDCGETMTIAKFMKLFELYREERWQELVRYRNEVHEQKKCFGDNGRTMQRDELNEHFSSIGSRLSDMKSQIERLKEENKNLKMDNF